MCNEKVEFLRRNKHFPCVNNTVDAKESSRL